MEKDELSRREEKKALKGFSTDFETWLIVEMNNLPSLVFYPF